MTLYTVCQGEHTVILMYYKCSACGFLNVYTGELYGIVPARKHTAYTLELMYYLVLTSCLLSVSYRSSFALSRLINESEGCKSQYGRRGAFVDNEDGRRSNRRVANEALRRFLATIQTDSDEATELMFRCKKCDRTLKSDEVTRLGLHPVSHAG